MIVKTSGSSFNSGQQDDNTDLSWVCTALLYRAIILHTNSYFHIEIMGTYMKQVQSTTRCIVKRLNFYKALSVIVFRFRSLDFERFDIVLIDLKMFEQICKVWIAFGSVWIGIEGPGLVR